MKSIKSLNSIFVFRRLLDQKTRGKLLILLAFSLLIALVELGATFLVPVLVLTLSGNYQSPGVQRFGDFLGTTSQGELIIKTTLTIVVVFVLKDISALLFRRWYLSFILLNEAETSTRLLSTYLSSGQEEHNQRSFSVALRRLEHSVRQSYSGYLSNLVLLVSDVLTTLSMIVAIFLILPLSYLALIAITTLISVVFIKIIGKVSQSVGAKNLSISQDHYKMILRAMGGFSEFKIRGTEHKVIEDYRQVSRNLALVNRDMGILAELPRYILEIVFLSCLLLVVLASGEPSSHDLAYLGTVVIISFRVLPSMHRIISSYTVMRISTPAVYEVLEELEATSSPAPVTLLPKHPAGQAIEEFKEAISFTGLSYRFSDSKDDQYVIRDITGDIPRGARIAIVGPSGAGKTTFINILCGLLPGYSGSLCIDGIDVRKDWAGFRKLIALVPQKPYIAEASLRENIAFAFGQEEIDQRKIEEAVKLSALTDVVEGLPQGLDTILPEQGRGLSGGQCQRIAIARALYRKAQILILDEATSALDDDTEFLVDQAIRSLPETMTVLCIAHRMSTIASMRQVALFEAGQVASFGSYSEVYANNVTFKRWVDRNQVLLNKKD